MNLSDLIRGLDELRTRFGPRARRRKLRLLDCTLTIVLADARELVALHDILLFVRAHPDDRDVLRSAEAALRHVARAARELTESGSAREQRRLLNTGIAGTQTVCALSYEAVCWLAERYARDVEIAWEDESAGDTLDPLLPLIVERVEQDGLISAAHSTQSWFGLARGSRTTDLAWLLRRIGALPAPNAVRERVFDALDLRLCWKLRSRKASRTFVRFPRRAISYQSHELERTAPLAEMLAAPLPRARPLPLREAERVIDVARATLAVRQRETDPVTYANPNEVTLVRLERGVDVALFGMRPERRLGIESYFGYVAAKNRIPISYGGGWVFFDRCEIGVNVFDTFRGGESARIFAQVLRVYHQHYRVQRFMVDSFQFGAGNTEAIRSGAFWFYYRLGFRPAERRVAERAAAEWERIRADRSYRTPARTLRALTGSPLELCVTAGERGAVPNVQLLGLAVTRWIAERFGPDRAAARRWATERAKRVLRPTGFARWTEAERAWFAQWSLLAALVPDVARWSQTEKQALVGVMRAKGGRLERTFALRLQRHQRLRAAFDAICVEEQKR